METSPTVQELQDLFAKLVPDSRPDVEILAPYLEVGYGEPNEPGEIAGTMGHLVVEVDEQATPRSGRSTKLRNVVVNIRRAVRNAELQADLLDAALHVIEGATSLDNPAKMSLHILLFLKKVHRLATVELGAAEALLLREMVRLDLEENTIQKADLEQQLQGRMSSGELYATLAKLEALGCVILTLDEVIFNETIEIRVKTAGPGPKPG